MLYSNALDYHVVQRRIADCLCAIRAGERIAEAGAQTRIDSEKRVRSSQKAMTDLIKKFMTAKTEEEKQKLREKFLGLDLFFHNTIYLVGGDTAAIIEYEKLVRADISLYKAANLMTLDDMENIRDEHFKIGCAILSNNKEQIEAAVFEHLEAAKNRRLRVE